MRDTLFKVILILVLSVCPTLAGQTIESEILQYKLDRLYFPYGTEANIYEHAPFIVYLENDSIYSGTLEFSAPGVSYSYPTESYFDTIDISSLRAELYQAEIDTISKIIIGSSEMDIQKFNYCLFDSSNILFRKYESHVKMLIEFEEEEIDGYLTYRSAEYSNFRNGKSVSQAPYFAALLPNLSHSVNYHGILSASLYYRFDSSRPFTYFDGTGILPQDCFYNKEGDCRRIYDYNSADGRKLLESMRVRPKRINISISDNALNHCAKYFADILSRDRIRTNIVAESEDVDIRLVFVDYDINQPEVALKHIIELLASDTTSGDIINKSLNLAAVYLRSAVTADHPKKKTHYLDKTERVLKEDLGVFPLFRPGISFITSRALKGYYFNDNGYLDLTGTIKLVLPEPDKDR